MKAKRRIHGFNFSQETMQNGAKTHVALVDKAANCTEALVMKSKYVTQSTEVEEFHDDGSYTRDSDTVYARDYGDGVVYVTNTQVRVTETQYNITN
tara:strand:+ start:166 stop:453 length:288 start_codon:yes stop_codon:yes gene_type:complete